MSSNKNLVNIVKVLLKWWKLILIVTVIAAAGSVVIALMLPNYYKSTVIFYPKNLNTFDSNYLFGEGGKDKIQSIFGDKSDLNRVITIANSSGLRNGIVNQFELWDHYEIDTTRNNWRYYLIEEFDDNTKILKSEYDNIELSVWDQDPKLAADIANTYVNWIGDIYVEVVKQRVDNSLNSVKNRVTDLREDLDDISDSVQSFSDTSRLGYKTLRRQYDNLLEDYNHWNSLLMQYQAADNYEFNGLYIVEKAYAAEKKDKPVRWLIVVSSTLAAFILSILAVLFIEQYKAIKEDLREDD